MRTQPTIVGILKERAKASPGWTPLNQQFVQALVHWLGDLFNLPDAVEQDLIDFFTGKWDLLEAIRKALQGIDLTNPGAVLNAILEAAGKALGFPGVLSISRIANIIQDLINGAGEFLTAESVEDNPFFQWDSVMPGFISGGSIRASANGTQQVLRTEPFEVFPGQKLELRAASQWTGASATAGSNPVKVGFTPFDAAGNPLADVIRGSLQPSGDHGWQWIPVADKWPVPTGVKYVSQLLILDSGATAGTFRFSNASAWASNLLDLGLVKDLREMVDAIGGVVNSEAANIEARLQAITADGKITASEILGLLGLGNIPKLPTAKVHSPIGSADIGEDLKDTWNNFWNAVFGDGSTGRGPVDVSTATAALKQKADDAYAAAVYATDVVNLPRLTPRWMSTGINDDVSFPIINAQSTFVPANQKLVFIPITPGVERTYRTVKFAVTGNGMTQCYVGVYRINASLQIEKAVDLGNVKSLLSGTSRVQALTIPSPGLTVAKGQTVFIGVLQNGNPQGLYTTPGMPTVLEVVQNIPLFFTQDGGTGYTSLPTLVGGHVEFTPVWGALGESTNLADQWTEYSSTGSNLPLSTYDIAAASTVLYLAGCGGGGGGGGGDGGWNKPGEGGGGGSWNSIRLERGVDIPWSVTQITVQSERVGSPAGIGGEPGTKETDGKIGHDIVFRNGTDNSELLRCAGGRLGRLAYGSFYNRDSVGYGPGDLGFSARLFKGGPNTAASPSAGAVNGAPGNGPGGGGAGGGGGTGGSAGTGGWGAAGYAAIKAV
ncbi:glycine-rich domain-containing protein [Mycobacteroides abscessus]|uniref:glycine-rich domain-containing protein n=1 Tax=Mycobacteroides abscessus TaxID=36809 RepID=UPI00373FD3BF